MGLYMIIQTKKMSKHFDVNGIETRVLKEIDLKIEAGEFVALMGPSGSGKSTLLYLLGGLDKPSSGSVFFEGKEISTLKDKQESILRRRKLGFIFQFYNLIPTMNVVENILLPVLLDGKKIKDYEDKLTDILTIVGLADKKHHRPNELSGGQQQRVAIARALINDPDVILADEPTGNLDSKTSQEILQLLAEINQFQRKTIIMVTHSSEAAGYSQRIITLKDGILS